MTDFTASPDPRASDPHRGGSALSEIVLGGQDGLVNVLGVILGLAAASSDVRIVIAGGLAAALAESVSMAAVAFTSVSTEAELYRAEAERERRHLAVAPELERDEIRRIYEARGLRGEALERVVEALTSNRELWVAVMMADEHRLRRVPEGQPIRSAVIVGLSALAGSLIPLAPFFALPLKEATAAAFVVAFVALFAFGAYKTRVTVGRPLRGGLVLAAIGLSSAIAGSLAGWLFRVPAP